MRVLLPLVLLLLPAAECLGASCRPLSSTALWNARVKGQVLAGMRSEDVRLSWGPPSKIKHRAKRREEWVYRTPEGAKRLYLAADGCVESRSLRNQRSKPH